MRGWALAWRTFCGENDDCDFALGMGGVMLANSDWAGGLRDRVLPVSSEQRRAVEPELRTTIETVINNVFPLHGLETRPPGRAGKPVGLTEPANKPQPQRSTT